MKKLLLLLSVVLAGCGGGGGAVPTTPVMLTASVTPVELFATSPKLLPDLRAKYDLLCGSEVMVQTAIPVDLNKDGKMDLVFTLWCRHNVSEAYTGPVPNTLVAFIQTSTGVFEDKTKEIFGSDIVDIGGISIGYVVTDLNSDGYDDMVLSCNREDNRIYSSSDAFSNMKCQTVSFISDRKGKYNKVSFGNAMWGDDVKLIKDKNGNKQIMLLPADWSPEVWTFNGQWNRVSGFEWLQKTPVFIQPANSTSPTMIVNKFDNGRKLEIWNNLNDEWSKLLDYFYLAPTTILLTNSSMNTTTTNIFKVDNNDYIDYGGLYQGCALKRTKDGPVEVLYSFVGKLIKGGYTGQPVSDGWDPPVVKLISLGATTENLNININPITLNTDHLDANFYHMECGDINGDGIDDILIRTTGTPLVYVNNGQGKFGKLNSSIIPKAPNGAAHIYVDIDGDGIKDLLYFPIDRWQFDWRETNTYTKVQFQLYKGNRAIMQDDLIFAN